MTEQEIQREKKFRYAERLGILCGDSKPTLEQIHIALAEAEEFERNARAENRKTALAQS